MAAKKPSSDAEICNLALSLLNQPPITDIDNPTTKTGELSARWYHQERRATLRSHPWNFASKREILSPLSETPAFGYDNAFQLPSTFIRLVAIGDDQYIDTVKLNYQIEDGKLLTSDVFTTDSDQLKIRYVYDITDVNQFDPLFVEVLAHNLAIRFHPQFSQSGVTKDELKKDLQVLTSMAFAVDGQDRPPTRFQRSKLIERRRGFSRRGVAGPFEIIG